MLEKIKQLKKGQTIEVAVKTNSPENEISGFVDGALKVCISAPPEKGKANIELLNFLKRETGLDFRIVSGISSRRKFLKVV